MPRSEFAPHREVAELPSEMLSPGTNLADDGKAAGDSARGEGRNDGKIVKVAVRMTVGFSLRCRTPPHRATPLRVPIFLDFQ